MNEKVNHLQDLIMVLRTDQINLTYKLKKEYFNKMKIFKKKQDYATANLKEDNTNLRDSCAIKAKKQLNTFQAQKEEIIRLVNKDTTFPRFLPTKVDI